MSWELVSFVLSSKLRFRVLVELNKGKMTPSDLARITKSHLSNVSATIKELERKNLIRCLTPGRRKKKFYEITEFGRNLLDFISREIKGRPISPE